MDFKEFKKLSRQEQEAKLADLRKTVRELRFSIANSQLKNLREIRQTKQDIARILTIINSEKSNASSNSVIEQDKSIN